MSLYIAVAGSDPQEAEANIKELSRRTLVRVKTDARDTNEGTKAARLCADSRAVFNPRRSK